MFLLPDLDSFESDYIPEILFSYTNSNILTIIIIIFISLIFTSMNKTKEQIYEEEFAKQENIHETVMKDAKVFKKQFVERSLKLVTSGFGLVSALAWNELIKEAVSVYIKPYFGKNSGLISLAIYAILVTALAVFITYQLSKVSENAGED